MTSLSEHHILVTRPSPQGEALCKQLEAYGATTYHVPVINIQPRIVDIFSYSPDIAIFISVHAVNYCDKNFFDKKIAFFFYWRNDGLSTIRIWHYFTVSC
ncbi:MAG: hypothetical protein LRY43_00295 [Gammaproteobacteria bacterium]|nr:hypothetical protein [Gammaproteobacteria bacterium]